MRREQSAHTGSSPGARRHRYRWPHNQQAIGFHAAQIKRASLGQSRREPESNPHAIRPSLFTKPIRSLIFASRRTSRSSSHIPPESQPRVSEGHVVVAQRSRPQPPEIEEAIGIDSREPHLRLPQIFQAVPKPTSHARIIVTAIARSVICRSSRHTSIHG